MKYFLYFRGEIANWEGSVWNVEGARKLSTEHEKNFDTEICANRGQTYVHLPYRYINIDTTT